MQFVDTAGRIDKFKNKYGKWRKDKGGGEPAEEAPAESKEN